MVHAAQQAIVNANGELDSSALIAPFDFQPQYVRNNVAAKAGERS